ncbi:hypothetical protein Val02_52120 [Virgisporangium aliadipatigenens]|uniref:Fibronectin type-III domain-containing protein n=1 Tax=Virgisporangium aliadipatigenens TaxID=741659 RepID=A0A8J4DSM6_9ACTN|nr:hypothetical protein [Virgisporangium aliadipatigenens]GIJ48326.1 hypothetical protein Val02_52120 [Virgisporangium aliadipatigenens]
MAFDPQRYEQEVIRPLRGRQGRLSDDDLLRRYAVEPGMGAEELRAHLRRLRAFWNQKAGGADSGGRVCKQLLAADEELRRTAGEQLHDPSWWAGQATRQSVAQQQAVEELAADLRRTFGGMGLITRVQLDRIVTHYGAVPAEAVERAARQAKVRVVDAVSLPTESGLDRTAFRGLLQRMREIGADTVVHLVHPDLDRPFTLARAFTVAGGPKPRLDAAAVEARVAALERSADSATVRARKAALRVLSTGLKAGADLRTVALYQVVERLVADRSQGLDGPMLVTQATRLGLTRPDAELIVVSLPTGLEPVDNAASRIRDLLADGQLLAAQQALSALPVSDPERADVEQAVRGRTDEMRRLMRDADAALRDRRDEEAERLLREAARIAADDQDLATRVELLPPAPPRDLSVVEAGGEVRLSWQPSASAVRDARYVVVRAEGRAPRSPQEGTRVRETASTNAVDRSAPPARDLHYGVFTVTAGGTAPSRPATARARVVPPVENVRLHAQPTEIAASWTVNPDAVAVRVRRTQGRAPTGPADGVAVSCADGSFVDRGVVEGQQYFYGLVAVYRDAAGTEVTAPMSVVSAWPRAAAQPVLDLTAVPLAVSGDTARVRLSWPAAAGNVRIRYASRMPTWEAGELVPLPDLDRFGRDVAGTPVVDGDRAVLDADVPNGPQVYVPFAFGGTGAVVGRAVELAHTSPIRQLHARRAGGQVVLTWVWPEQVRMAEVEWNSVDVPRQVRRVSRAQYVDGDGCVLAVGAGGGTATVRSVTIGPTGESMSAPAEVSVDGRPTQLRYALVRLKELRARWSRRRVLVVTAAQDCADVELVLVSAVGAVMPLRPEDGVEIDRFSGLRLTRDVPLNLDVELPSHLRRPYWLRCFVLRPATVSIVDPPVAELKVS